MFTANYDAQDRRPGRGSANATSDNSVRLKGKLHVMLKRKKNQIVERALSEQWKAVGMKLLILQYHYMGHRNEVFLHGIIIFLIFIF